MAENVKENKSSKGIIIILIVIIILLLAGGTVAAILLLGNSGKEDNNDVPVGEITGRITLPYEEGAVLLDQESLDAQLEALQERADEGVPLMFKNVAVSEDGENFICSIGNPEFSTYDMYIDIYKDVSLEEQLYISGLIPPGSKVLQFQSKTKLSSGEYNAVLVLTQIEDDHATIRAQTMVYLTLLVD